MASQTCNETCTFYVDKDKMPLYKNKFIWIVSIVSILVVALFVIVAFSYRKSLNTIVDYHSQYADNALSTLPEVKLSKDSCFYLDERFILAVDNHMNEVQSLLEIQSNKIQSDFMILSLWAGILMIVFLIFSIYSVFKTDEMMKQGRDTLNVLEETKESASTKTKEIETIVEKEIGDFKTKIEQITSAANTELKNNKNEIEQFQEIAREKLQRDKEELKNNIDDQIENFRKEVQEVIRQVETTERNKIQLFYNTIELLKAQMETETMKPNEEQENKK